MPRPRNERPVSVKIFEGADGLWHGYKTVGKKPNGRPDVRHRTGRTKEECEEKIRLLEDEMAAGTLGLFGGNTTDLATERRRRRERGHVGSGDEGAGASRNRRLRG